MKVFRWVVYKMRHHKKDKQKQVNCIKEEMIVKINKKEYSKTLISSCLKISFPLGKDSKKDVILSKIK